jgi:hypothetical protein
VRPRDAGAGGSTGVSRRNAPGMGSVCVYLLAGRSSCCCRLLCHSSVWRSCLDSPSSVSSPPLSSTEARRMGISLPAGRRQEGEGGCGGDRAGVCIRRPRPLPSATPSSVIPPSPLHATPAGHASVVPGAGDAERRQALIGAPVCRAVVLAPPYFACWWAAISTAVTRLGWVPTVGSTPRTSGSGRSPWQLPMLVTRLNDWGLTWGLN